MMRNLGMVSVSQAFYPDFMSQAQEFSGQRRFIDYLGGDCFRVQSFTPLDCYVERCVERLISQAKKADCPRLVIDVPDVSSSLVTKLESRGFVCKEKIFQKELAALTSPEIFPLISDRESLGQSFDILKQLLSDDSHSFFTKHVYLRSLSDMIDQGYQQFWVFKDGKLVGVAGFLPDSEDTLFLAHLVVDAGCRGANLGSQLLEQVESYGYRQGFSYLKLESAPFRDRVHDFYCRKGYRLAGMALLREV